MSRASLPMGRLARVAGAARLTRWMQDHELLDARCLTVVEFPKSGGTWLAQMVGTAVEWPFLDNWAWPPGNNCVLRGHQLPTKGRADQIYMMRDPRDVHLSLFHHRVRHWQSNERYRRAWLAAYPRPLAVDELSAQLADFIGFESRFAGERGSAVSVPWGRHVEAWLTASEGGGSGVATTYEALRADPVSELRRVLTATLGDPGIELAEAAVTAHRFDLRQHSTLDLGSRSFLRSGKAGGWRDAFDAEAGQVLERLHGAAMRRAGYEESEGWWHDLPGR
jgi:hypothetical protein